MKTRINHVVKQLISLCMTLIIFTSTTGILTIPTYAAENSPQAVTLSLNSNVVSDNSIELYMQDSVYYITIEDLCALTRCSQSVDGHFITVAQGFWGTTFDVEKQMFDDGYQSVSTTILKISTNQYAVPALMFLSYFKATAFIKDGTLNCTMDSFTAWEALNVDYSNTLIDIYEVYGGEENVTLSLTLDIIMDFIMGNTSSPDGYMSEAFLEALKVNPYEHDAVKAYVKNNTEELYGFLHSESGKKFIEILEDGISSGSYPLENATKHFIESYYYTKEKSFVEIVYNAKLAGEPVDAASYGKKFHDAFQEKNQAVDNVQTYFEYVDYLMMYISAAAETANQLKYTNATNNLVYQVMGEENLKDLGISIDDNAWFSVANRYQNVLGITATQLEAEAMQIFTDEFWWSTVIGKGITGAADISTGAWTCSLSVARIFAKFPILPSATAIEAFEADRNALYLSELQQNVYWIARNIRQNMHGQWDNKELYTKYIQAQQLYCRTSIAMYENLITMVKEQGQNKDYWTALFQERIDKLAISLYQLTMIQDDGVDSCLPLDLTSFACITPAPFETDDIYEGMEAAINEAAQFAWDWFWDTAAIDHDDTFSAPDHSGYETTFSAITTDGITTIAALREHIHTHYSYDVVDTLLSSTMHDWVEKNGKLYVSKTWGLGGVNPTEIYMEVIQKSDTCYEVKLYEIWHSTQLSTNTIQYYLEDGHWIFDQVLMYMGEPITIRPYVSEKEASTGGYKEILQQYSDSDIAKYTLYDIDKNEIPECIVFDKFTANVYTLFVSTPVFCGTVGAYYNGFYAFDGNGIIIHSGGFGNLHFETVALYTLSEDGLERSELLGEAVGDQRIDLYKLFDSYTKIENFCSVSDFSLLESN